MKIPISKPFFGPEEAKALYQTDNLSDAVQQIAKVDRELGPQRLVQAQLFVHLGVGRGIGVRADDGQHRVQGHDPSDEKGQ